MPERETSESCFCTLVLEATFSPNPCSSKSGERNDEWSAPSLHVGSHGRDGNEGYPTCLVPPSRSHACGGDGRLGSSQLGRRIQSGGTAHSRTFCAHRDLAHVRQGARSS